MEKTELKVVLIGQATCLGIMEAMVSHFAFNMKPQRMSLLRIRKHGVE